MPTQLSSLRAFGRSGVHARWAVYALKTPASWSARPRFDPALTRDEIDPRVPGKFEKYYLPGTLPVLWFGEPTELDQRLVAQSGLFVVPGVIDRAVAQEYHEAFLLPGALAVRQFNRRGLAGRLLSLAAQAAARAPAAETAAEYMRP